jgi:hypothetical protein
MEYQVVRSSLKSERMNILLKEVISDLHVRMAYERVQMGLSKRSKTLHVLTAYECVRTGPWSNVDLFKPKWS